MTLELLVSDQEFIRSMRDTVRMAYDSIDVGAVETARAHLDRTADRLDRWWVDQVLAIQVYTEREATS